MTVALTAGSPLAKALTTEIQRKLEELGWSAEGDDSSPLSEYICLLVVNGKSQTEIATDISGDYLEIADPTGAEQFAQWLFEKLDSLSRGETEAPPTTQQQAEISSADVNGHSQEEHHDEAMDEDGHDEQASGNDAPNIPTGPKAMRQPGGARLFNQLNKAMERNNNNDALRRRPQQDRVDKRDAPRGPRTGPPNRGGIQQGRGGRGGPGSAIANMHPQQRMQAFVQHQFPQMGMPGPPGPHGPQGPMYNPNAPPFMPQQMPPNMFMPGPNGMPFPPMPPNGGPPFPQQQQHGGGRGNRAFQNGFQNQNQPFHPHGGPRHHNNNNNNNFGGPPHNKQNHNRQQQQFENHAPENDTEMGDGAANAEMQEPEQEKNLADVVCYFGHKCAKPDCPYGHPSPAAPIGRPIVISANDKCPFGLKCKNIKCTGSHPSPASAPKPEPSEIECKFYPNCKNAACPFKHPPMPPCRNGPSCTRPGCYFTHTSEPVVVPCRYFPCLNAACKFSHQEGQQGKFEHKVWKNEHVSDRKFVEDDTVEELIIPGQGAQQATEAATTAPETTTVDSEMAA